jgi:hypothetical protein
MSHFTCMVIGPNPDQQLEKYDEGIVVDQYVKLTKEQIIEKQKNWVEEYKNTTYAGYLEDTEQYCKDCSEGHANFLKVEFPLMMEMSDEELYQDYMKHYDAEDICPEGGVYSTYNPHSKWDWYQLGGRWTGMLKVADNAEAHRGAPGVFGRSTAQIDGFDQAEKGAILNLDEIVTFAVVKDGEWFQQGEMGWWGMHTDEMTQEEWVAKTKELLNGLPEDTMISIIDCHI